MIRKIIVVIILLALILWSQSSCNVSRIQQKVKNREATVTRITIDLKTGDVMLKVRHVPVPIVYPGSREEILSLIGGCVCPQPIDTQLMLVYQFDIRTRQISGQALCVQSDEDQTWCRVLVLPGDSRELPFKTAVKTDDHTVTVLMKDNTKRVFKLFRNNVGMHWEEIT